MPYHSLLPSIKKFLYSQPHAPAFLEIGTWRGCSFIPLVAFLARSREEFLAVGIDVNVQESLAITLANIDVIPEKQRSVLVSGNSLELLPQFVSSGVMFDVILVDGDHNYHTVSKELEYVKSLLRSNGVIICDDYFGRWSERDQWYSELDEYASITTASKRVETEKHGVRAAVDDWLESNKDFVISDKTPDCVILSRITT